MKSSLSSSSSLVTRRHCIALMAQLGLQGPISALAEPARTLKNPKLLVLGDSLSAEYGLARGSGWVALLEQRLAAQKITATVINASISGDTSSGGRSRLPGLLERHQPTIVIIELGGNDALRGLPLQMTQDNLLAMAQAAQALQAKVLLLGMQMPPNYGQEYAERFAKVYATVAKTSGAALVPFFLKNVADGPQTQELFQSDRIHPNAAAQPLLLDNVWPSLKKLLAQST